MDDDPMQQLHGHSITYRVAVGAQRGRKVFMLQTVPANKPADTCPAQVAKVAGFSVHAGVMAETHQRDKLERLCRYISRPAVSQQRLSLTANGNVRYKLKTAYRDGTTPPTIYMLFSTHWTLLLGWHRWYLNPGSI